MLQEEVSESREVQVLSADHAEGVRTLSMEPDVAGAAGLGVSMTPDETLAYMASAMEAREAGIANVFVLTDGAKVLGICRLIGVRGVPRLIVAVGRAYRGQGNGSFLVRHVLQYAFETLDLERVTATGPCLNLVSHFGLADGDGLDRQAWTAARARN
jgi:RimJ/RimL family protein N-acetyltransferase